MMGLGLGLLMVPGHTHPWQIDQCRGVNFEVPLSHATSYLYGLWRSGGTCPILNQSMVKGVWCKLW